MPLFGLIWTKNDLKMVIFGPNKAKLRHFKDNLTFFILKEELRLRNRSHKCGSYTILEL